MDVIKNFLAAFIVGVSLCTTISVNTEEGTDETKESTSESATQEDKPINEASADKTETEEVDEDEEAEKESATPPKTPWKRLPITTKIPVNYDIDLPQDI